MLDVYVRNNTKNWKTSERFCFLSSAANRRTGGREVEEERRERERDSHLHRNSCSLHRFPEADDDGVVGRI